MAVGKGGGNGRVISHIVGGTLPAGIHGAVRMDWQHVSHEELQVDGSEESKEKRQRGQCFVPDKPGTLLLSPKQSAGCRPPTDHCSTQHEQGNQKSGSKT